MYEGSTASRRERREYFSIDFIWLAVGMLWRFAMGAVDAL